jgi:hypothetical protein
VLDEALERVVPGLLDDLGVLLNLAGFERTDGARAVPKPHRTTRQAAVSGSTEPALCAGQLSAASGVLTRRSVLQV